MQRLHVAAVSAVLALTVAGCSSDSSGSTDPDAINLGFIYGIANVPFSNSIQCGAELAAEEFGAKLNFQAPANWSVNEQKPILDAVLATRPDALVLAPTDPEGLTADVESLMADDVPVITVDSFLADENAALARVASNHYEGGEIGAEAMIEETGGTGSYLVIGYVQGDLSTQQRADGFIDAMEAHGATILPVPYPGNDQAKAAQDVSAALKANPDLAGIFATNAEGAKGASNALVAANMQGEIPLISFDASPDQVQDLRDGLADMLLAQQPFRLGYVSARTAIQVATGEVSRDDVPEVQDTSFTLITRDNVDDPEVQAAIYASDTNNCPTTPPSE